jgi:hypothetical protein
MFKATQKIKTITTKGGESLECTYVWTTINSYIKPECKRIIGTDKIIRIYKSVFCSFLN